MNTEQSSIQYSLQLQSFFNLKQKKKLIEFELCGKFHAVAK